MKRVRLQLARHHNGGDAGEEACVSQLLESVNQISLAFSCSFTAAHSRATLLRQTDPFASCQSWVMGLQAPRPQPAPLLDNHRALTSRRFWALVGWQAQVRPAGPGGRLLFHSALAACRWMHGSFSQAASLNNVISCCLTGVSGFHETAGGAITGGLVRKACRMLANSDTNE